MPIYPTLVLRLLVLMLLANLGLHHFLICALSFPVEHPWLVAFYYANPLYFMCVSLLLYAFRSCLTFPGKPLGCKIWAGCIYTH